MTCSSNVVCRVFCNVVLNVVIRSCGRWRINFTVFVSTVLSIFVTLIRRNVGSRVVNNWFVAQIRVSVMRLKRVDLSALVYFISEIVGTSVLIRDCRFCLRCFLIFFRRDCICTMRLRNKRRSVSSWVLFGLRKFISFFCFLRWVQLRIRRVVRWRSCVSLICNLFLWVRVRWAKIFKIRSVRSIIRYSYKRFRLRFCVGFRVWLKRTIEVFVVLIVFVILIVLFLFIKYFGCGVLRLSVIICNVSISAEEIRDLNFWRFFIFLFCVKQMCISIVCLLVL